jgi:hypothetical protein
MLRWALRLLLASVVLSAIGFITNAHAVFEVIRVVAGVMMTAGVFLLLVWYVRTPQPPEK